MRKKLCIIHANCQGEQLRQILKQSREFCSEYKIKLYVTYRKDLLLSSDLKACRLFIYQPLGQGYGSLSSNVLLSKLPGDCRTLAFSYLTFEGYWPFFSQEPRNENQRLLNPEKMPPSPYPFGDAFMLEAISDNKTFETAIDDYLSDDIFPDKIDPNDVINRYYQRHKEIESRRDIKLLDFIMENFREKKLFHTYNHPSIILLLELANRILSSLGMQPIQLSKKLMALERDDLSTNELPVHPRLTSYLNCKFQCNELTKYRVFGNPMTFREYFKHYYDFDLQAFPWKPEILKTPDKKTVRDRTLFYLTIPYSHSGDIIDILAADEENPQQYKDTLDLVHDSGRMKRTCVIGPLYLSLARILPPSMQAFTFLAHPVTRISRMLKEHKLQNLSLLHNELGSESFLFHVSNLATRLLGGDIGILNEFRRFQAGEISREAYFERIGYLHYNLEVSRHTLEAAKKNLETMLFFGTEDDIEIFYDDLSRCFGCEDIPKKLFQMRGSRVPNNLRDSIIKLNELDMELYEYAKDVTEKHKNSICK